MALVSMLSLTSCWEWNRQQDIKDAEAKGIATLLKAEANAEIERAKGVAEANKIIGNSLQGNEDYLKYLQIEAIKESKGSKVYIPTEAGLPILEAK